MTQLQQEMLGIIHKMMDEISDSMTNASGKIKRPDEANAIINDAKKKLADAQRFIHALRQEK